MKEFTDELFTAVILINGEHTINCVILNWTYATPVSSHPKLNSSGYSWANFPCFKQMLSNFSLDLV